MDVARTKLSWYPDPAAYQYGIDSFCCTGGAGFYGSSSLIIRAYKNSRRGNAQECHLHLVGQAARSPRPSTPICRPRGGANAHR